MTPTLVCVVDVSVAIKLYLAELLAAEVDALFTYLADPTTVFSRSRPVLHRVREHPREAAPGFVATHGITAYDACLLCGLGPAIRLSHHQCPRQAYRELAGSPYSVTELGGWTPLSATHKAESNSRRGEQGPDD